MPKLKIEDLLKLKEQAHKRISIRDSELNCKIYVHMGTCGIAAGAREIMKAVLEEIEKSGRTDVAAISTSCAGLCSHEPMITVEMKGEPPVKYIDLTPQKVKKIFQEHVLGGKIVKEYALAYGSETEKL